MSFTKFCIVFLLLFFPVFASAESYSINTESENSKKTEPIQISLNELTNLMGKLKTEIIEIHGGPQGLNITDDNSTCMELEYNILIDNIAYNVFYFIENNQVVSISYLFKDNLPKENIRNYVYEIERHIIAKLNDPVWAARDSDINEPDAINAGIWAYAKLISDDPNNVIFIAKADFSESKLSLSFGFTKRDVINKNNIKLHDKDIMDLWERGWAQLGDLKKLQAMP